VKQGAKLMIKWIQQCYPADIINPTNPPHASLFQC